MAFLMGSGVGGKGRGLANVCIRMAIFIMANGRMIKCRGMESISGQKNSAIMKANGKFLFGVSFLFRNENLMHGVGLYI